MNLRPSVCDEMLVLRCINLELLMTEMGQNEKPPFSGLCQLPPAADITIR